MLDIYIVQLQTAFCCFNSGGTADALLKAEDFAQNDPFVVLNGDAVIFNEHGTPAAKQLADAFEKTRSCIVGVQKVEKKDIFKYASVRFNEASYGQYCKIRELSDLVEKPKNEAEIYSLYVPLGRHVLTSDIFGYITELKPDVNGELVLTDAIRALLKDKRVCAYEFDGKRYDVGDKLGYAECFTDYALKNEIIGKDYLNYLVELTNKKQ